MLYFKLTKRRSNWPCWAFLAKFSIKPSWIFWSHIQRLKLISYYLKKNKPYNLGNKKLPSILFLNLTVIVLPHAGIWLVLDYFCFIPKQIVFKEEQIVYCFERLNSRLIALFWKRFDIILNLWSYIKPFNKAF